MSITDEEFEAFLEHHGIKGQKWGVRNINQKIRTKRARRVQRNIDVIRRVASGTGDRRDKFAIATNRPISSIRKGTQATSKENLARGKEHQDKIAKGKEKTLNLLLRVNGIRIADLNYSTKQPSTFTRKDRGKGNALEKK